MHIWFLFLVDALELIAVFCTLRQVILLQASPVTHRLVALLIRVPVSESTAERLPVAREQGADLLQCCNLELMGAADDDLPVSSKARMSKHAQLFCLNIRNILNQRKGAAYSHV